MSERKTSFAMVVIGCSAGGIDALRHVLSPLPKNFRPPIVIVTHIGEIPGGSSLSVILQEFTKLPVEEAWDKAPIMPGRIYVAPSGYHLLVEDDNTFSLSTDPKVCNVRPSIDVLFESAAYVFGEHLLAVILTGANKDGTHGLQIVHEEGGICIVQDPFTAVSPTMPTSAVKLGFIEHVVKLDEIADLLVRLTQEATP
jgi:two-component system chemotaxis response regulator CheB